MGDHVGTALVVIRQPPLANGALTLARATCGAALQCQALPQRRVCDVSVRWEGR